MAQTVALTRNHGHRAVDMLRAIVVTGCALALIAADAVLPGLTL